MPFIAWPEIEGFHNIRKYTNAHPEILNGKSMVNYRCKVKLHGTNAAIQCHQDGRIIAQSRTGEVTVGNDNAGFAKWVEENREKWLLRNNQVIYGEWIGPGIQKGVAVSSIPKKSFAVFAVRSMENPESLLVEPADIKHVVSGIPDTYIIPWYSQLIKHPVSGPGMPDSPVDTVLELVVDWSLDNEALQRTADHINEWVSKVEANDPWVETVFGIKGTGEGLVFYPVSREHEGYTNFSNLVFKAKGEKHKNIATAKPAQVDAAAAASIDAFVDMVLTPARLEQGARAIMGEHKHEDSLNCLFCTTGALTYDVKLTGKFVNWVSADVEKETQDELAASNLTWKQVQKAVSDKARAWYLAKYKNT